MPSFGLNNNDTNAKTQTPTSAPFLTLSYFEYKQPSASSNMSIVDNFKTITNAIKDPVASITPDAYTIKTIECSVLVQEFGEYTKIRLTVVQSDNGVLKSYSLNEDINLKGIFRSTDLIQVDNLKESLVMVLQPNSDTTSKYYSYFSILSYKTIKEVESRGLTNGKTIKVKFFGKGWEGDQKIEYNQHTLDFSYIASRGFGFGLEKKTFQGTSRKSVQQTKGIFGLDSVDGSFYVDTWGNAPDKITIGGKIEIPHGYDYPVKYTNGKLVQRGRQNNPTENSFIGTIEDFYQKNANPLRVNRGEYLTLNDYYTGEFYIVTIKSRNFEESVDNPNIYSWSLELIVLQKIDIKSYQGAKVQNKGFLNTFF
jgi:hypothetical protein